MEKKNVSFEEKLKKLDEIVGEVENRTLPLEESVKLFNEGMQIIKEIEESLDKAEKELSKIINVEETK